MDFCFFFIVFILIILMLLKYIFIILVIQFLYHVLALEEMLGQHMVNVPRQGQLVLSYDAGNAHDTFVVLLAYICHFTRTAAVSAPWMNRSR